MVYIIHMYTYVYICIHMYVCICVCIYIYSRVKDSKSVVGGMADVPPKVRTETDLNMPTSTDECSWWHCQKAEQRLLYGRVVPCCTIASKSLFTCSLMFLLPLQKPPHYEWFSRPSATKNMVLPKIGTLEHGASANFANIYEFVNGKDDIPYMETSFSCFCWAFSCQSLGLSGQPSPWMWMWASMDRPARGSASVLPTGPRQTGGPGRVGQIFIWR